MGVELKQRSLDQLNRRNFQIACRYAQQSNVSTVLLTGKGEPTLHPLEINWYLDAIKKYEFPFIELQTNGLLFGNPKKNIDSYLQRWYNNGLTTIALSIADYRQEKNKRIFCPNSDYINLEDVINLLHGIGYSIRLSCILMKNYIDSVDHMLKLADFCRYNRVEQLTFRRIGRPQVSTAPGNITDFIEAHKLSNFQINDIRHFFDEKAVKLMDLMHGATVYEWDGQNICLTDCLTIDPSEEKLRQLIFFPDGHLRYDWQYQGAILL